MLSITLILIEILLSLVLGMYIHMLYSYARKVHRVEYKSDKSQQIVKVYKQAPGPIPWPIIGNIGLLVRYNVPFIGFTELAKEFGDIFTLTLGSTRCLVVNNLVLIREVLNQNGKFFGGRPDFLRYHKLFGGDRNNSLALCDWSTLQQQRRNLARQHCSPRISSSYFTKMSNVGCFEVNELMARIKQQLLPGQELEIKPLLQQACANMFMQYMCSKRFEYDDLEFKNVVTYFDEIFWEINQGYAVDFMPWLSLFYLRHMKTLAQWSTKIRKFILERLINEREKKLDLDAPERDFTDALLKSLIKDQNLSRDTIMYMLEDFIGGHSAVGNLVMMALANIAKNPTIGKQIQQEVDGVSKRGQRKINLYDMESMPYTMATIFEVLRYTSSPIVPHVATEDAVISGYGVTAGTVVFINNYELNTSSKYWQEPEKFYPQRFLETVTAKDLKHALAFGAATQKSKDIIEPKRRSSDGSDSGIEHDKETRGLNTSLSENSVLNSLHTAQHAHAVKPNNKNCSCAGPVKLQKNIPHFLPFSVGKRTCIGQNLVRGFGFILLSNILQQYDVSCKNLSNIKTVPACVALPTKTFSLAFTPRITQTIELN